jgi:hypothetical protein
LLISFRQANIVALSLVNGWREAGRHEVTFDPKGASGSDLPSGIYIYRMEAGKGASVPGEWQGSGKMILLK